MTCCFLLVPSGLPVLVSLLVSSFCPQERGSVPSWFAGSSWFRLRFRVLVSLLLSSLVPVLVSLLLSSFFLRKGVLFHHDLRVPLGSGRGSGACLPSFAFFLSSGKGFCSIMICWFLLVPVGFRCLSPLFSLLWFRCLSPFFSLLSFLRKGVLFHHDLRVPLGSGRGSRCLSPFFCLLSFLRKGVLFHHDLLVPLGSGGVPVLVSLLLSSLVLVLVSLLLCSFFPQEIRHPLCLSLCLPLCFPLCLQFVSNFVPGCVFHFVSHFVSTLFANLSLAFVSSVYPLLSSCWPPRALSPTLYPLASPTLSRALSRSFLPLYPPTSSPIMSPTSFRVSRFVSSFFPLCLQLCPSLCLKLCLPLRRSHCLSHRLRAQSKNVAQTWSLPRTFPLWNLEPSHLPMFSLPTWNFGLVILGTHGPRPPWRFYGNCKNILFDWHFWPSLLGPVPNGWGFLTILVYMNAYLYIHTGCVVCLVALVVGSTYVSHCMVYPHHTTSWYTSHKVHDTTSISEDYTTQEENQFQDNRFEGEQNIN